LAIAQALGGFVLGQALLAGIEVGEGDGQAVARFTGGAHGQAGFAFGLGR
jgi:hypothetical protein